MAELIVVHGSDEYRRMQWIQRHVESLSTEGEVEVVHLDEDTLSPERFVTELTAPPMFTDLRVLQVNAGKSLDKDLRQLLIDNANDGGGILVLLNIQGNRIPKKLKAAASSVESFDKLTHRTAPQFIADHVRIETGTALPSASAAALVEVVGPDAGALIQEVRKYLAVVEPAQITPAMIQRATDKRTTGTIWDLATALSERNFHRGHQLLAELRKAGELRGAGALIPIAITFLDLCRVKAGDLSGMPPWKARKLQSASRKWGTRELDTAMIELTGADYSVKTGSSVVQELQRLHILFTKPASR